MNPPYSCFIFLLILLLVCIVLLSVCLVCRRRQLRHILKELWLAERQDTGILLTCAYPAGQTKELVLVLNRILEKHRQSLEQLQRENRGYRESIISISHDIRTPMTSAKGYLQMSCHGQLSDEKKAEYAAIVLRRLDDLSGMLDQLFLYTRLKAGEALLYPEEINASSLFADTIALFYDDFVKKGFEPEVLLPSKPCRILADRPAFTRIVENLLRNALQHGTGECQLSLRGTAGEAVICISNRTVSIQKEDISHIFDRFYTTDTSRNRKTTGLGLAIVNGLAAQMGGGASAALNNGIFSIEVRFPLCGSSATIHGRKNPALK